jgi:hypothetical protein
MRKNHTPDKKNSSAVSFKFGVLNAGQSHRGYSSVGGGGLTRHDLRDHRWYASLSHCTHFTQVAAPVVINSLPDPDPVRIRFFLASRILL